MYERPAKASRLEPQLNTLIVVLHEVCKPRLDYSFLSM